MAREELVFDVKTNIKSATKETKEYTQTLSEAQEEQKNLNEQLSIQKSVITDLEKELVLMEAQLKETPKTGAAGFYALQQQIEETNKELKLEKIGLKEIENQIDENKKSVEELEKATKDSQKGFKGLSTVVKGFGTALKAAGIGLIVAAFAALKEALERNQKAIDLFNTVVTTISTTFNQVVQTLTDVVVWVTASTDRFNGLGSVIKGIVTIAITPLKLSFQAIKLAIQQGQLAWEQSFLGGGDEGKIAELRVSIGETITDIENTGKAAIDAGKNIVTNFGDAVTEIGDIYAKVAEGVSKISIKGNYEQAKANKEAKIAEVRLQGLIEKNDKLAEVQRQIRDDETKTFADRLEANRKLGEILDEQEKDMLALADKRVEAAKLELDANKDNVDLQVAYQQALNDRAGVEAQIAGFRSEQLTNQVSLEKELLEAQRELAQEGLTGIEKELLELENAYKVKLEMARKSGADTTAITEQYEKQKSAIVKANINAQIDAYAGLANALIGLAGENKELAVASAIIDTFVGANKALSNAPPPLNYINMAAVIATGLANVQKIMQTSVPGSANGGSTPSIDAGTPSPQILSGKFELTPTEEPQPVQAYVVTDSLTDNQNKLAYIRRRATI